MGFGTPVAVLAVSHITDTLPTQGSTSYTLYPADVPLIKPAEPQIEFTAIALNEYSKSCRIRMNAILSVIDRTTKTMYAELVVDGVSRGIHPSELVVSYWQWDSWGDFDPHVSHTVQLYLWMSETLTNNVNLYVRKANIGTASDVTKTVWEKSIPAALLGFSTDGIHDVDHLYVDDTLVTDYALWWSGSKIAFKGTDFDVDGNLIYQRVTV